jgi:hypothetical protein
MRVELPTRIPLAKTLLFASVLFVVQLFEHTSLIFALFFFAFLVLANLAFNAGGGFSRAAGSYVFMFTLLTCGIGVTWKAVVGEPADSNLLVPTLDMACYAVSMFMLLLVVLLNKTISGEAKGIAPGGVDYTLAALGCLIVGVIETALNAAGAGGNGSLLGVVNQLSQFLPLAIILGTIGAIKDSGGRRSVNFVGGLSLAMVFVTGTLAFSKTGMLTPMVTWFVAAAFMRFKLRPVHWVVLPACAVFAFFIAPTIAGGRIMVSGGAGYVDRARIVVYLVTHLREAREEQVESNNFALEARGHFGYYNKSQGFLDRLSILSADDTFFDFTNRGNYIGLRPVIENYENFIPHFLVPDKPVPISGNFYAHEIGGFLADADDSTGISFSPVAEAFHSEGWAGICLILPAIWLSLFVGADYICGDFRRSPWGLLLVVIFAHAAAESLLGALIWLTGYGLLGILVAILFCTEFAPVLGALFYGGNRRAPTPAAKGPSIRHRAPAQIGGTRAAG